MATLPGEGTVTTEKVTSDSILESLIRRVEAKEAISKEEWLDIAFKLNLLRIDEAKLYNKMHQAVAKKKLEIKEKQEKVNISAIELEIEAEDSYRMMQDQEDKIYSVDQFVMIAKKNSDAAY